MKGKWVALITLYALSVVIRIYPGFITSIPYNVDALTDSRASQFIAEHGNLKFPSGAAYNNHHTPVTPLFNALSAAISQLTGINVMHFLPFLFPFITSISVIGWYMVAKKFTKREDIAIVTASFFAISGTYVLQTALVWKEAVGFVLMPFAIYAYRKKNAIGIFLLFILPLTHHYVALLTYMIITLTELLNLYEKYKEHLEMSKEDYLWLSAIAILWIYMTLYYSFRHFDRLNQLSPSSSLWLFLSLFFLFLLAGIKVMNITYKKIKIWYIAVIFSIPLAFYILYFSFPIFSHTMLFNQTTFEYTIGYVLLIPLIAVGLYILSTTSYKERKAFLAILLVPLQMILFFILHGFDPGTYDTVSRTYDFLDPATHTSLAVGTFKFKKYTVVFPIVFIVLASTTPIAYHTSEAFGVSYFIYPDELHGAKWIKEYFSNRSIATDDKLGLVAKNEFDINASRNLPYLLKNDLTPSSNIWLIGSYWGKGAQMCPMAPIKVNVTRILQQNSVVFSSGRTFVVLNSTS